MVLDPREVERRALTLAALRPRDDDRYPERISCSSWPSASLSVAAIASGAWGAQLRSVAGQLELQHRPLGQAGQEVVRRGVELRGVVLVDRAAHLVGVIGDRGLEILLGEQHDAGVAEEIERAQEAVEREQLGDVRALALVGDELRRDAQLGLQLGRRRDLHLVEIGDRALRERRERPQRLDLDVEEVDAHRVVGGRGEEIEQAAADRELAAVLHLLDPLVPAVDELDGELVEVDEVALLEREAVRPQLRVGDPLGECSRAGDDHRRGLRGGRDLRIGGIDERVDRGDPQTDEVRRRSEVTLVGDASARVPARPLRREPRRELMASSRASSSRRRRQRADRDGRPRAPR